VVVAVVVVAEAVAVAAAVVVIVIVVVIQHLVGVMVVVVWAKLEVRSYVCGPGKLPPTCGTSQRAPDPWP